MGGNNIDKTKQTNEYEQLLCFIFVRCVNRINS